MKTFGIKEENIVVDKEKGKKFSRTGNLVSQILSYVSEVERNNIKERWAEGIALAKAKGVKFCRSKRVFQKNSVMFLIILILSNSK